MPRKEKSNKLKVFIASSAELKEERKSCIIFLNHINKSYPNFHLEPVEWEYDIEHGSYPDFAGIQPAINKLLKPCKFCIFLFYSKIGKYTREEFELAKKLRKKIFPFFKKGFSPETKVEFSNWKKLIEFKREMNSTILYEEYRSSEELELKLKDNLNLYLSRTVSSKVSKSTPSSGEVFEARNTNEIILSSQPLTSLDLLLIIENSDTKLKSKIKQGIEDEHENAMDTQGGVPRVPFQLKNFQSQLVPIIEYLGSLNDSFTTSTNVESTSDFVLLIALDGAYNCILSFGDFANDRAWSHDSKKRMISAGFMKQDFFSRAGRISYPQAAGYLSEIGLSHYSISWNLDPITFQNSIDRAIENIQPTARLPKVLELIVLSDIKQLPFAKNDFSKTDAVNLWRTSNSYLSKKKKIFDASIDIVVNGISEMAYHYDLKGMTGEELWDEFEYTFDLKCKKFLFERD